MSYKILVTDYVWHNTEPERAVLAGIDAELIEAPDAGEDTLASMVKDVDGILTCFAQVTEKVVRAATKCVGIGRYGVGYDNIAVDVATELGIAVTYVPDYCVEEVSDHVLGLLYAWNRRIPLFDNSVKTVGWGSIALDMPILRLRGKTLGLLGYGRIGRAVGQKAHALGFQVLVYDPYISADSAELSGVRLVDMETVLKESDFISIHTPLNAETENLVAAKELALMKPTAFLINCARGPLIDEAALYDALINKRIGGAGLGQGKLGIEEGPGLHLRLAGVDAGEAGGDEGLGGELSGGDPAGGLSGSKISGAKIGGVSHWRGPCSPPSSGRNRRGG